MALLAFALAIAVLALLVPGRPAAAHAELVRSDPPDQGLLAAPPAHLDLWFSEAVASGGGSPEVKLLDAKGNAITLQSVTLDPANREHVRVAVPPLAAGTYTVVWTTRSADDGHILSGTYAFTVGGSRAPGAATVQGERPRAWAVATRWLTFLGTALAAGGFLFARVILPAGSVDARRRRRRRRRGIAVVAGAAVALLATVAEPLLLTRWPPTGSTAPSLDDAIRGLPNAWWIRPAALIPTLLIGFVILGAARGRRRAPAVADWAGLGCALVALLGLSLTGHGAARGDDWRALAIASDTLHVWAIALWVGGLAQLALNWSAQPADETVPGPVRRFSWLALPLVAVAVGTGVLNAGLILPTLRSLWSSTYGDVLIAKSLLLVPPLALATFHRAALRRWIGRTTQTLRTTVRVEAALVLLVVLAGSVLAMLAPPIVRAGVIKQVNVTAPAAGPVIDPSLTAQLIVAPARPGPNTITVNLLNQAGKPLPADQISLVRLDLTSLDHDVSLPNVVAAPTPEGFKVGGVRLSLDGWWRLAVTFQRPDEPQIQVPFYLILPDPNVNGAKAVPNPPSDPKAKAVYERGLHGMTSLHSVRFTQRLSGGTGTQVTAEYAVSDGSDGQPPASSLQTGTYQTITVGNKLWSRDPGAAWQESEAPPLFLPSEWGDQYAAATGFRLGPIETVDGERCQIVTFYLPATEQYQAASFAWWVGLDSGRVRQETMVASYHYMVTHYTDFNGDITITPPGAGPASVTPAATPAAR